MRRVGLVVVALLVAAFLALLGIAARPNLPAQSGFTLTAQVAQWSEDFAHDVCPPANLTSSWVCGQFGAGFSGTQLQHTPRYDEVSIPGPSHVMAFHGNATAGVNKPGDDMYRNVTFSLTNGTTTAWHARFFITSGSAGQTWLAGFSDASFDFGVLGFPTFGIAIYPDLKTIQSSHYYSADSCSWAGSPNYLDINYTVKIVAAGNPDADFYVNVSANGGAYSSCFSRTGGAVSNPPQPTNWFAHILSSSSSQNFLLDNVCVAAVLADCSFDDVIDQTPPSVTTVIIDHIDTATARVHGRLTSMGNGAIVAVSADSAPGSSQSCFSDCGPFTSAPHDFNVTLTGLLNCTNYSGWAVADVTFPYFASASGNLYNFTTACAAQVHTLTADDGYTTHYRLNGNLDAMESGGNSTPGCVSVYFYYGDTTGLGNVTPSSPLCHTGLFLYTIYGLIANHTYYYRACANGTLEACGSIVNFTTLGGGSGSVGGFSVDQIIGWAWLMVFVGVMTLMLIGAFWIRGKRGGGIGP